MICLSLAAITVFPSTARQWQKSSGGIRWVDEDGEWVRNTWEWIDDDWNGTAECDGSIPQLDYSCGSGSEEHCIHGYLSG